MMEAVRTSETSVYFESTRRYTDLPEGCHLHTHRRKKQKSHDISLVKRKDKPILLAARSEALIA
jgi:hypothetical protein